jgi:hypothetical protein
MQTLDLLPLCKDRTWPIRGELPRPRRVSEIEADYDVVREKEA